jgi:hypothetical protein
MFTPVSQDSGEAIGMGSIPFTRSNFSVFFCGSLLWLLK